ncbi:MAG: ferrous iron transport protein A [Candidatus Bathyarchaeota archaeon]|nr:ferrous iron transport protein A [Candidatus Bathyarchaeota archaeon]
MQIKKSNGKEKEASPKASSNEVSLVNLKEGEKGIMTRTEGCCTGTHRLAEMGLIPGSEIKLLRKCSFHGPLEIQIRGVSLALGYGLACKVMVQPKMASDGE